MRFWSRYLMPGIACLFVCPGNLSANQLPLFLERADGLQFEKQQDFVKALVRFKVLLILLERIQMENPDWEHDLVTKDVADSKTKIAELEPLATKQIIEKDKAGLSYGPQVYLLYDDAAKEPDALTAMHELEEYHSILVVMHNQDPKWMADLIEDRIKKSQDMIVQLAPKVLKGAWPTPSDGRTVQ